MTLEDHVIRVLREAGAALGPSINRPPDCYISAVNDSIPANSVRSGKRIAVVEDVEDLATTLVMLLEAEGYVAHSASDGAAGIALVKDIGADAVLLDYWLPDMTGRQVAEALSAGAADRAPKILLCTSASEDMVQSETAWYHAYLRKPVTRARLVSALDATLAR